MVFNFLCYGCYLYKVLIFRNIALYPSGKLLTLCLLDENLLYLC